MPTATKIILRKERDFGEVLNATFQFLRQNAGLLVKSLLFIAGPALALGVVINPFSGASGFLFNPTELQALEVEGWGAFFFARIAVGAVLSTFGWALAIAAVNEAVALYRERGPGEVEWEDVWRRARRSMWKVIGTSLLLVLLFGVALVIVLVPCLGALAYLVGFVYFGTALSLAFIAQAEEGAGAVASLGRSRALVRDYFWPTFGVVFVSGIIYYALSTCFSLPSIVITMLTAFHGIEGNAAPGAYGVLLMVFGVIAALGGVLAYAVPLVAIAFQYYSLVEQKERTGLMERVEAMEQAAQTSEEASEPAPAWTSGPTSAEAERRWEPPRRPLAPPDVAGEAEPDGRPSPERPGDGAGTDVPSSADDEGQDASDAGRSA